MRVGQSSCQEESEVGVVWHRLVTNLNGVGGTSLNQLHEKDGLECWVELLTNVLKENPLTELDSELKISNQRWMRQLEDLKTFSVVLTHVLNEFVSLSLWVNHEWPSTGTEHDNTVFD